MKYILSVVLVAAIASSSYSQTTGQKIDQVKKDPETTGRAAKADARLINNKIITDSVNTVAVKKKETSWRHKKAKKISPR